LPATAFLFTKPHNYTGLHNFPKVKHGPLVKKLTSRFFVKPIDYNKKLCYYIYVKRKRKQKAKAKKKFSKPIDKHRKVCYNNNVKGRWATAPKKKFQKSLKNPLTSKRKGAIIKAQRTKKSLEQRKRC